MRRRALSLAGLWLGVFAVTAAAESLFIHPTTIDDAVAALVLLPITASVGGYAGFPGAPDFLVGVGCTFLPVWALLAYRWLKHGPRFGVGLALVAWMTFAFWQPVSRLQLVMSA